MTRERVRLIDIARHCGLSKAAVARALSRPVERSEMRQATYERIHRAAQALGYRRPRAASAESRLVGLAIGGTAGVFFGVQSHVAAIASLCLAREGDDLVLLQGAGGDGWVDRALERACTGILVCWPEPPGVVDAGARTGIPLVGVDSCHDLPVPRVLFDDVANGRCLTEQLLALGHRRLAFLAPRNHTHPSLALRQQGWQSALGAAGVRGRMIPWDTAHSVADLAALLRHSMGPTGLVCYSDREALDALQLAHSLGIRVPEELSIIGCNGARDASWPPLSSLELCPDVLAKHAVAMLNGLRASSAPASTPPAAVRIPGILVPGATIAPPPAALRRGRASAHPASRRTAAAAPARRRR